MSNNANEPGYTPPDRFVDGYTENPYIVNPYDTPWNETLANPDPQPEGTLPLRGYAQPPKPKQKSPRRSAELEL